MKIFVKLACVACLLGLSVGKTFAQSQKLTKTKIGEKIEMGVPEDFTIIPSDAYKKKYGTYKAPLAAFTSPDGKANFSANQMANRLATSVAKADWKEEDLKILQGMYKNSILAMHAKVDFIQDKIEEINKKKFIVFEFIGTVRDVDKDGKWEEGGKTYKQYAYIQYTVQEAQVLIFNFSCPDNQRSYYQQLASKTMHSIKLK